MGVHAYVVGATVVAIGTSLPELVTVVFSRLRGHDDVGVGTLIGSNLFNGLAIVGTAASIHPIHVSVAEVSVALVLGTVALAMLLPDRTGIIGRFRGVVLLATYVGFIIATSVVGGNAT
jgi:cation:H+ antiporter